MKLAVLGGGGVRSPLLVAAALRRAKRIHLDELCLMDTNPEKLRLIGALCQFLGAQAGSRVKITLSGDGRNALEGASYIITTIRVGEEQGRVYDERIALKHGVLGQETTGPGGFAMAMRSIPAILDYAHLAEQVCPGAWMFNFTNPAGLVAQALQDRGFARTVGICDGANQAQREAARVLDIPESELRAEVFGLNHLSWTRKLVYQGQDLLPRLLEDESLIAQTSQQIFAPALRRATGMWMNEYLFYYHYRERALESIQAEEMTRGEEVLHLNRQLLDRLREIDPEQNPEGALRTFAAYERRRSSTYMHYAHQDGGAPQSLDIPEYDDLDLTLGGGEGYAGVALGIIEAFESGIPLHTALNVPNRGAIACMQPGDVVEVSCTVADSQIRPDPIGEIPEAQELLARQVKCYERLAVDAILNRSREQAVLALMAHPLVQSYSLAEALTAGYLAAHAPYVGEWS